MEEKKSLGKYIQNKRKNLGMTQKELAAQLFVSESAVSKWERGLSYPDMTLVSPLCEALHISEHELFTASDDWRQRQIEEQARRYKRNKTIWLCVTCIIYAAMLFGTLTWGITTGNGLTTFAYTFGACALLFSLIDVPMLAENDKGVKCFAASFASLLLLEIIARIVSPTNDPHWLWMALPGTALGLLSVFLPIILAYADWDFPFMRHKAAFCLGVDSALIGLLVIFGQFFYGDGHPAVSIASTASMLALIWGVFIVAHYTCWPVPFKISAGLTIGAAFCLFTDALIEVLEGYGFRVVFNANRSNSGNIAPDIGLILLAAAAVLAIIQVIILKRRPRP